MSLSTRSKRLSLRQLIIFALLAVIMLLSKLVMEALPNIHLLGMLTITYTIVYRWRALIPIYLYVFLNGLVAGFSAWWLPYLYIWTILWALTMLIPRRTPRWLRLVIYPVLCSLHGLFFGALYAPVHALLYGFNFEQTLAWIGAGLAFDILHAVGNFVVGLLVLPLSEVLLRLERRQGGGV